MTKKDFEMLAKILKRHKPVDDRDNAENQWESIVNDITIELARTNPRFDVVRFKVACGD